MKTKQEFVDIIDQTADGYDQVAALRRAGDPRYFQHQEAMATMLAMFSQQVETAMMEPFDKVRDATILADAALKGIIPKATPARVKLTVYNSNKAASFALAAGRRLTDASGNLYEVDRPVTVPTAISDTEPGVISVEAIQKTTRTVAHTVTESRGFYTIEAPAPENGQYIAEIAVQNASAVVFQYKPGFTNTSAGDLIYHVESDAYQRLFVKFGLTGVVGYQPAVGEVLTLTLTDSVGDVRPAIGSPFSLEYAYTPADSLITVEFSELLVAGSNPISITDLRELCRYPSTYDDNAVYRGEFDFLVRRHLPNLPFLSVWNEQIEERMRGASLNNINKLFISFQPVTGTNALATQAEISRIILAADDSYGLIYVPVVELPIQVSIKVQVGRIHDIAAVTDQIKQAMLSEYGRDSLASRRGMGSLKFKRVYEYLRGQVIALQDDGSDFSVEITLPTVTVLPEHWRFVSETSLSVTVSTIDYGIENWGH